MKTSRRFTQLNRVFLNLRIATAVTLLSAAAAMAFVATNPSGPRLLGKSDDKAKAELQAQGLRSKMLGRFETSSAASKAAARDLPMKQPRRIMKIEPFQLRRLVDAAAGSLQRGEEARKAPGRQED